MSEDGRAAWFETVEVQELYAGRSTVRMETIRTPDGEEVEREIVDHDDAVAIVPVTDDGQVLLLKQYRQPVQGYLIEIPAGTLDVDGEDPIAAARRELIEELHHDADDLVHLTTFSNSAGWTTERTHIYLGRGLRSVAPPEEFVAKAEEADMEVVPMAFADAVAAARAGEFVDAKTALGLLLAAEHLGS